MSSEARSRKGWWLYSAAPWATHTFLTWDCRLEKESRLQIGNPIALPHWFKAGGV